MWKWIKRTGLVLISFLAILMLTGSAYQFISTKKDENRYPPPGKLVDVGGYRLHINSTGKEGPTVVFDAGMGCNSLDWSLVQPEVAKFARVCIYDRAGNGWSDESPLERTSQNIVNELHTLLQNSGEKGPFILVGHSFGGPNVLLFASLYPDEVAALVLVDWSSRRSVKGNGRLASKLVSKAFDSSDYSTFFDVSWNYEVFHQFARVSGVF